jgi:hypothetical protein
MTAFPYDQIHCIDLQTPRPIFGGNHLSPYLFVKSISPKVTEVFGSLVAEDRFSLLGIKSIASICSRRDDPYLLAII